MTLKTLMESLTNKTEPTTYNDIEGLITAAEPLIFKDYPIFDESYRSTLNRKILGAYLTREIGCTPASLWLWRLNEKLADIMPYYNQLYKSAALEFEPFEDVNYSRTGSREGTKIGSTTGKDVESGTVDTAGESTRAATIANTGSSSGSSLAAHSDTPQGSLANLENLSYVSRADKTTDSATNSSENTTDDKVDTSSLQTTDRQVDRTGSSNESSNEGYGEVVKGKTGGKTYAGMLKELRETYLNIDMLVIGELEELFFQLY